MASAQNQAASSDLFDSYFRRADSDRDGRISGVEAVTFFQGSGLAKPVLAKIWDYADQSRTGFLGRPEFYNALRLVTVAQSKRELTPEIVKAALYGPTAARIPAPQINLAAIPLPHITNPAAAPAPRPVAVAQMPSQSIGYSRPPVLTSTTLTQQNFSSQGSQLIRPPQAVSASSQQPTPSTQMQGISGGAGAGLPPSSTVSGGWSTGPSSGSAVQVPGRGVGPSLTQSGFESLLAPKASLPPRPQAVSGMIPPKEPVKDAGQSDARNGFASGTISGGGQLQPAQPLVRQGPQGPNIIASSIPSSANSQVLSNHASSHVEMSWPKMTEADVQKYMKVFVEVDTDKDGKITGEQARNLFLSWRLPREILKQVWDLSDQDNDSMLSLREFCIALYLMERHREGRPLPSVLPGNIVFYFPSSNQPAAGYTNAGWRPPSGFQQKQVMHGQHTQSAPRGKPPLPPNGAPVDGETQAKKSKVPILEKHLVEQLSKEEQNSLNTRFQEAMDADKKVEELEKQILESKQKVEFFRVKMQELVLYKSRCDNRVNEIMERISGDKREVEILAKKYEEKYRRTGDVASKLSIEEATFRDIQEKKMDLYRAIIGMDKDGKEEGAIQDHATRIQSDLDELVKALNERCKSYGLRAKPTTILELPFGWQPGIQATTTDWDEDWDKFQDEGYAFVKELTLDVQNVVAPPKEKCKPTPQVERAPKAEESPNSPAASPRAEDAKHEKPSTEDEHVAVENGVHHEKSDTGGSPRSVPGSPRAAGSIESPQQKEEIPEPGFGKATSPETSGSFNREKHGGHEGAESVFSGDKSSDGPTWGTFDHDDDSVWDINAASSSRETEFDKFRNDFFLGSENFSLNPIKTSAEPSFPRRSVFDESVPSTPMTNAGFSPTYNKEGELGSRPSFDGSFRSDSFNIHDGGLFSQRETLSRFDSMQSSKDYDHGHRFPSFDDDSDPFGSGPFKSSFAETPRRDSDVWSEPGNTGNFGETPRSTYNFGETPSGTNNFGETPRGMYSFAETPKSTYNFGDTSSNTYNWGETRASNNWGETPRGSDNWGETPKRSPDPWGETPKKSTDNWSAF